MHHFRMRVLILSFFLINSYGCFSTNVFKKQQNLNQQQPSSHIQGSIPKFDTLDVNKDGVVTKDEHKQVSDHSALLTPYIVFSGILFAIVFICFLSAFKYEAFWVRCTSCISKARKNFINLLKSYKSSR